MNETSLSDFGDDGFRPSLDRFVDVAAPLPRSRRRTRSAAYGQMVNVLSWRLRMIADRKRYPAIAEERIVAPLVVIGFPALRHHAAACPADRVPGQPRPALVGTRPAVAAAVPGAGRAIRGWGRRPATWSAGSPSTRAS